MFPAASFVSPLVEGILRMKILIRKALQLGTPSGVPIKSIESMSFSA
jgi:hypothetical protein